jgi:hypothetical protein
MPEPLLGDWSWSDAGPWITLCEEETGRPHLMPDFGPKHEMSELCWCHPVVSTQPAVAHNVAQ